LLDRLLLLIDDGSEARGSLWELCRSLETIYDGTAWIAGLFRNLAAMMARAAETTQYLHLRAMNDDGLFASYLEAVTAASHAQKATLEALLVDSEAPRVERVRALCREGSG
jgi:hypothetical protein